MSHDREFLDGLVDKVYEFGGGKVREHLGGIYDYLRAHNAENINAALAASEERRGKSEEFNGSSAGRLSSGGSPLGNSKSAANATANGSIPASGKQSYAEHKEQQKKIRKAEKAVQECEKRIASLEKRKKEIDEMLMKPENATNMELVTEYTSLMKKLDEENDNWMTLSEALEELSL